MADRIASTTMSMTCRPLRSIRYRLATDSMTPVPHGNLLMNTDADTDTVHHLLIYSIPHRGLLRSR